MTASRQKIEEFFKAIDSKIEVTEHCFNKGATTDELDKLESALGFDLPVTYKELLQHANGEGEKKLLTMGLFFSSFDRVLAEIERFKSWDDHQPESVYQKGMIKPNLYNPKRIPFASDESGQYLCIDFDPDVKGQDGQIIYLPTSEPEPVSVIAASFDDFLDFITAAIKNNQLSLYDEREDWDEDDWEEWRVEEDGDLRQVTVYFERGWKDDWTDVAEQYNLR
ncbi:SMI1/KNR4 family protein [Pleionea sp. CnH1-48]|uniref:SMI1/KNR4 family protein n=1 Tax=Pleionea sp. CnH1-48 TaxID=2954494 RepID=UPI0020983294|nr:SMI1/KNR4 family protein [Pleionea sp. CnH1-48]MCO7223542.1 SMI1/KNR4 family protein [Pleionea sp. CnH1-48]